MRHLTQRGVSLIELLVSIAITGILMAAAAPSFSDYIHNSRLREAGNALLAETLFTQSEAIKRNGVVRLVISGSTITVSDQTPDGGAAVLRTRTLPDAVVADVATTLNFGSEGRPTPFGTASTVNLSRGAAACTSELRCPRLVVEAGGAVRLCGDKLNCT